MEWVRPITNLGSLTSRDYTLDNGNPAVPLHVVQIYLDSPKPEISQPENWLLQSKPWRLVETLSSGDAIQILSPVLDSGPVLLTNTSDHVTIASLGGQQISASLTIIEPKSLSWVITTSFHDHRQTRAVFKLGGQEYNLVVTDPVWHARLGGLTLGNHSRNVTGLTNGNRIFFTISLGKAMNNGDCYKLVAGVIVLS